MSTSDEPIELEPSQGKFKPEPDRRVRMDEPLPVRIVAVADVRLPATAGMEKQLEDFYVGLWQFARDAVFDGLAFHADNFRVVFEFREGLIVHEDMRPLCVEVLSLAEAQHKLTEREIEHLRQKALQPGSESILLQDPAGNWVELTERRTVG